jgi:hypothetical protein
MKRIPLLLIFLCALLGRSLHAQDTVPVDTIPKPWTFGGQGGVTYNEVSLTNWAAGGQSNMTLIGNMSLFANRKFRTMTWDNSLDVAFGFLKNNFIFDPKGPITKAEDKIELNSKYGKKAWSEKVFYTGLATFRTQFAKGVSTPGAPTYISKAMSPAYLIVALGLDFKPTDYLSLFVSPASGKVTIVTDDSLSNAGAFGVNTRDANGDFRLGSFQHIRMEFGATFKAKFKKDIMKNVGLESILELFTNYLDRPENIDVRWSNALVAKVNKFIVVNLFTDLIYDNDILTPQLDLRGKPVLNDDGSPHQRPQLQFKQVFGLGFSYKFASQTP